MNNKSVLSSPVSIVNMLYFYCYLHSITFFHSLTVYIQDLESSPEMH